MRKDCLPFAYIISCQHNFFKKRINANTEVQEMREEKLDEGKDS